MTKGSDIFRKCYWIIYIIIIFNIFIAVEPQSCDRIKGTSTVYPAGHFDSIADGVKLQEAMTGVEADSNAIVEILTKRDAVQRLKIAKTYKTHYGEDLNEKLSHKLPGNVNKIVMALMTPLPQYYAEQLHNAVTGQSTDEKTTIDILCTLSNYEVDVVADAYEQLYGKTLEHDLKANTTGSFQRLMVSVVQGNREGNTGVDSSRATDDAKALWFADSYFTKVTQYNKILVSRSYQQLCATFAEYKRISNHDIEEKIKSDIYDFARMGFLTIVKSVKSKVGFFAEKLDTALKGIVTDHSTLIRIIVSRSEMDLDDIKQVFFDKYGKTLASRITADTTGYYQKALLSLLGN